MSFGQIMTLEGQLLLMMAVGFLMAKIGVLDEAGRKRLANILFYVVLPCNTFNSFAKSFDTQTLINSGVVILAAALLEAVCVFLPRLTFRRFPKEERLVMTACMINPNPSFVGLPIAAAIYDVFDNLGTLYVNMSLLPIRLFIWIVIVAMFEAETGVRAGGKKENIIIRLLKTPVIVALILGFIRFFTQPTLPVFFNKAVQAFSGCTSALAMLIIGSVLGSASLKGIFTKATIFFSFFRLLVMPALTFVMMNYVFHCDPIATGVVTIIAGTPAGTTTPTLAQKYNCAPGLCAQAVTCSTILMLFTLPLIMAVIPVPAV